MNRDSVRQIANISGVVGTLIINALSQILPFNNQTSAQIANQFNPNNYFLPANYVFSIWSVIYVGLIAFAVWQALPAQKENPRLRSVGYWFVASCVANCVWLFLFHWNQFALSTVAMVALIASLVVIYRRIRTGSPAISTAERLCLRFPFSVYLGWITVALVANITFVLLDAGWDGFGIAYSTWGVIMIVVAGLIAAAFAYLNRDIVYAAVLLWSFFGINRRFPDVSEIALIAVVVGALIVLVALASTFLNRSNTMTSARA
jgi:translocator protein